MSTSVKRRDPAVRHGLIASAICLVVSLIYEAFSHGVISYYMLLSFLCPLADALFFLMLRVRPCRQGRCLLHTGVAALTVGCFVKGVLDIFGTTSEYTIIYFIVGAALALAGAAVCLITRASSGGRAS